MAAFRSLPDEGKYGSALPCGFFLFSCLNDKNKKAPNESELGANDGTRTHDLLITNQLLYRLSHISKRRN